MALKKIGIVMTVLVSGLIWLSLSAFTVWEFEDALVIRFGEIQKVIVNEITDELKETVANDSRFKNVQIVEGSGLHFKLPFLDEVVTYDHRYMTLDTQAREVITNDKKRVILDNNAQWRVSNPLLFHVTMGNYTTADTRIDDLMYAKLNERVGRTLAHDLISNKEQVAGLLEEIETDINQALSTYGIYVLDIQIKRTDLPTETHENIFNRMRTEREQMATQYRSEGESEATRIRSEADSEARVIVAEAELEAKIRRGEAEAEATRIYNEAYGVDPEFYEFYQALQTYKATIDDNTTLVIDENSPFAKYFFTK